MNERIKQLADEAGLKYHNWITNESNINDGDFKYPRLEDYEKFAELIVEECRTVVSDVYRKTPLELCGPLLTADEKIAEHFYGVEL